MEARRVAGGGHLTFPKPYASSRRPVAYQHQNAYLLAKGQPAVPENPIGDVVPWTHSGNKLHPTQKTVSVLAPLIESFCPRGGVTLDPFAGSGATRSAWRSIRRVTPWRLAAWISLRFAWRRRTLMLRRPRSRVRLSAGTAGPMVANRSPCDRAQCTVSLR